VAPWHSKQQRGDDIQQEQWQHHGKNSSGSIIGKGTVAKLQIRNLSINQWQWQGQKLPTTAVSAIALT